MQGPHRRWTSRNFTWLIVGLLASTSGIAADGPATPIPAYEGYELVWHDEFSVDGPPDPANWTYETGFVRNRELQWYQHENVVCADGILRIEARRDRIPNPNHDSNSSDWRERRGVARYSSASLTTRDIEAWQYGRFEIRARIPVADGLWPVIWTVGTVTDWPAGGEIDIAEFYRDHLLANGAWASRRPGVAKWDTNRRSLRRLGGQEWSEQFHIWRMDWDEDHIILTVDDKVLNKINVNRARNPRAIFPRYPFRHPHQLFLSLAVGGTNGGKPVEESFPAYLEIDYVRVYQRSTAAR